MANGVIVQLAVFSVSAAIVICLVIVYKRRKAQPEPSAPEPSAKVSQVRAAVEVSQTLQPNPMHTAPSPKPLEAEQQPPRTISMETASANGTPNNAANVSVSSGAPKQAVVTHAPQAVAAVEDRNERILAGISENIRKTLAMRPVPQHSPIEYSEAPRNTEYVRVKKEIITPHGQIRFSILKDSISNNMLAVFRRASLDWKTPDDLIAFLPSYLEPEAEILNDQVLLIGTPGHNEKLAVPIRSVDAESSLSDCFDFVADVRTATNIPAVLRPSDTEFEVVSRGVIMQGVFMNAVERRQRDVRRPVEKPPEALQESYSATMRPS
jgi:hypothetical protein